ncbi:chromo domain-containing protein [Haematococcus lacustris]|uniref:Chromo domain-containing protein n=1 Tax=Haematococcus lacustris TaxID=44745 RepID=A0A699ZS87_HAELA|nr:chromo domain-containing protein [Haematococcus lacustris]
MAGRVEEFEAALVQATEDIEEERRSDVIASMRSAAKAGGGRRQGRDFSYSFCGLRVGGKDGRLTAGCSWAMCPDGYLFPGFEMPDCESTRMTMLNILKWFEGREYHGRDGHKFVFVYDDMCHLLRWALKRAHLHPEIKRFTTASHAVDVFHFVHNHKGVWCDKMVNPLNVPALKGVNTEGVLKRVVAPVYRSFTASVASVGKPRSCMIHSSLSWQVVLKALVKDMRQAGPHVNIYIHSPGPVPPRPVLARCRHR